MFVAGTCQPDSKNRVLVICLIPVSNVQSDGHPFSDFVDEQRVVFTYLLTAKLHHRTRSLLRFLLCFCFYEQWHFFATMKPAPEFNHVRVCRCLNCTKSSLIYYFVMRKVNNEMAKFHHLVVSCLLVMVANFLQCWIICFIWATDHWLWWHVALHSSLRTH